ncbi:MAG: tetratricopeptide repeat-containing glycosyltransferase family 2 protein [Symbiobacteriia bacterium]
MALRQGQPGGDPSPLLSACLIVKDEERFLPRCLSSLKGFADEVCVVDTGSTDKSIAIAESFGARVSQRPWDGDFSAARNAALEQATGQWLLIIDADETLHPEDGSRLRDLLAASQQEAYFVQVLSYVGQEEVDHLVRHQVVRLIRNRPAYRYQGQVHEGLDLTAAGGAVDRCDIRFMHYGYLQQVKRQKNKGLRNLELLRSALAADPQNPYLHFNIGTEYLNQGDYETALRHYDEAAKQASPQHIYAPLLAKRRIACLQVLGEHFKAIQVARQAQKDFPAYTDATFLKAISLLHLGQLAAALRTFRSCVETGVPQVSPFPSEEVGVGSFKAFWWIGQIHERLQNETEAISAYREALRQEPRYRTALASLIGLLRRRLSEPETVLALELPESGGDEVTLLAAAIFRERGEYAALLALLAQRPLERDPTDLRRYWSGLALVRAGKVPEGLRVLRRIPASSPPGLPALLEQVLAAWTDDDSAGAQRLLQRYQRAARRLSRQAPGVNAYPAGPVSPGLPTLEPVSAGQVYTAVQQCLFGDESQAPFLPANSESRFLILDLMQAFWAGRRAEAVERLENLALRQFGSLVIGPVARLHSGPAEAGKFAEAPPVGKAPTAEFLLQSASDRELLTYQDWMDLAGLAARQGRVAEAMDCYRQAGRRDTCRAAVYLEPTRILMEQASRVLREASRRFPEATPLKALTAALADDSLGPTGRGKGERSPNAPGV